MNSEHTLWVEKYRPSNLDTYIGNDQLKSKVKVYLESGDLPHLLLFGKAGNIHSSGIYRFRAGSADRMLLSYQEIGF